MRVILFATLLLAGCAELEVRPPAAPRPKIGVMMFRDDTRRGVNLGEAATKALMLRLSRDVHVFTSKEVEMAVLEAGGAEDLPKVGRMLGADYLITGVLNGEQMMAMTQRVGDAAPVTLLVVDVGIQIQLIEVATGKQRVQDHKQGSSKNPWKLGEVPKYELANYHDAIRNGVEKHMPGLLEAVK